MYRKHPLQERYAHYQSYSLSPQFDAVIHVDRSSPLVVLAADAAGVVRAA
jgi:erythromycin esterase-like protein